MGEQSGRELGVAISGGGHRATVFGLGALLALSDLGLNKRVASVASVSGGSVANGIAMTDIDFGTATAEEFEAHIAPKLAAIANRGVLLEGAPATAGYIRSLILSGVLLGASVIALIISAFVRSRVSAIISLVVAVVASMLAWALFRRRSEHTEAAIDKELLGNKKVTFGQVGVRSVHHVICTTELQSGESFYWSPTMAYGYRFGHGDPTTTRVSLAVQASACVPGAFNPRVVKLASLHMSKGAGAPHVVLNDGGTYDNMADQWEYGFANRVDQWPELNSLQSPVRRLLVVNASKGWEQIEPIKAGGLSVEIAGLMRSQAVQYDVSTAHRRQAIYREFVAAERAGTGITGAFVQIGRSPFEIVDFFADSENDDGSELFTNRKTRADNAEEYLGSLGYSRDGWRKTTNANASVATTLARLNGKKAGGRNVTAELLEHGYVLTVINLHVLADLVPLAPIDRERFRRMCQ
jgi:hypothetical protein